MEQCSELNSINIKLEPEDLEQNEAHHFQMQTEVQIKIEPGEYCTENTTNLTASSEFEPVEIKCEPIIDVPLYFDNEDNQCADNTGNDESLNSNDSQESTGYSRDDNALLEGLEIEVDVQHIEQDDDCDASSSVQFTEEDRKKLLKNASKIHNKLKKHYKTSQVQKTFGCDQCDMGFNKKDSLTKHLMTHLRLKFDCDICHKQFSSRNNMLRHKNIHTGIKPYSCDHCAKTFMEKSYLAAHLRIHFADKIYKCPVCSKEFRERTHLIRHERIHSGERPYSCETCHKTFKQSAHLSCHRKIHKKNEVLYCDMCQQGFLTKDDLYEHHKVHIGEKAYAHSFVCEVCHREFSQSSHLNDHVRVHNGNRPFDCPVCGKPFSQRSTLNRHIRTHSGAKPFSCPVCKKKFKQKTHVVKHVKIHERDGDIPPAFPLVIKPDPVEENEVERLCREDILTVECNPDLAIKPTLVKTPISNSNVSNSNETVFMPKIQNKILPFIGNCESNLTAIDSSNSYGRNEFAESTINSVYISIKTEVPDDD
ncbi:hypothetical protein O0L34_g12278 [Tuta absoluta]|nr:hypothetical protein O0L34_g12278 [Tuta absoluta]